MDQSNFVNKTNQFNGFNMNNNIHYNNLNPSMSSNGIQTGFLNKYTNNNMRYDGCNIDVKNSRINNHNNNTHSSASNNETTTKNNNLISKP